MSQSVLAASGKQSPSARLATAKATVGTATLDLKTSVKQKRILQEEIIPYATAFLDEQDGADPHQIMHYLRFSTEGLMPSEEEGKKVYALCYRVIAESDCQECVAAKEEFLKYLPKRLSRRGFDARHLDGENNDFDAYMAQAIDSGCLHGWLGVFTKATPERLAFRAQMEVRDRGKRRLRPQAALIEVPVEGDGVYSAAVVALAESTEILFSELGHRTAAIAAAETSGPERRLRLEHVTSYQGYMTFKRRLVDGIVGLTRLEERTMSPGVVEFVIHGDVSMKALNQNLVHAVGAEPVIESHEVVNESLLKVVLK